MLATLVPLGSHLGPLVTPAGVLGVLVLLALIILVGRFLLSMAWRLVVVGIVVVGALYLLSALGFGLGLLG